MKLLNNEERKREIKRDREREGERGKEGERNTLASSSKMQLLQIFSNKNNIIKIPIRLV